MKGFRLRSYESTNGFVKWAPRSSGFIKGYLVYPLAVIFAVSNIFVLVMYLLPPAGQDRGLAMFPLISSYVGPAISMAVYGGAILYWIWDQKILHYFGYRFEVDEEDTISGEDDTDVILTFRVSTLPIVPYLVCTHLSGAGQHS
jgi:hypothetical protein